jgi:peptide/nickel transport system permease protein
MAGSIPASVTSDGAAGAAQSRWPAGRARVARTIGSAGGGAGVIITGALFIVAVLAGRIAPADPFLPVALPLSPPSAAHLMGTDDLGRDLLAGVVHGARTSLVVALAVAGLASLIGLVIGAVSGWRGALVDDLLMRLTEFVQVVPRFFLAVVVIALFGPGLDRLVWLLALTSWPLMARVVRAQVLSVKARAFVEAARSLGAPARRILLRDVLPNVLGPVLVVASLNAAGVILLEAGLSFLGLGDPAVVSWGYLANNAQRFLRVAWWMAAFPGAAIALAVLGLNLLGDALNDALEPRRGAHAVTAPRGMSRRSGPALELSTPRS